MSPIIMIAAAAVGVLLIILFAMIGSTGKSDESESNVRETAQVDEKKKKKEQLRERLIQAGIYRRNSAIYYYFTQIAFALIPVAMTFVGYRLAMFNFTTAILLGTIVGVLGVVAPGLWLDWKKAQRQTMIRRAIPDALDVITICVEAGLTLSAAIARVAKDLKSTYPMLAQELTIVHRQTRMGNSPGEALASFAERFDLRELRSLASVVSQSEKFGASIASGLRTHGENLREKRMQQAHERAQKAAVWILLPTVMCIFPALFVVILGPAAYTIYDMMQTMGK